MKRAVPACVRHAPRRRRRLIGRFLVLLGLGLAAVHVAAGGADRFVRRIPLPGGYTLVASEGEFEARSTGSYSLLVYEPAARGDETTFFATGTVQRRDGTVEDVRLEDLDGDGSPEIVVIMRSVGTGSYVSADAYRFGAGRLTPFGSVSGLPAGADAVAALAGKR